MIFLEYQVLSIPSTPHTHVADWASSSLVECLSGRYVHQDFVSQHYNVLGGLSWVPLVSQDKGCDHKR